MAVACVVALIDWELEQRVYRVHRDAFLLSADAFRRQYRLTKELVRWLCERLRGELTRVRRNTATALTFELQVLCALRFFCHGHFRGHGCNRRALGDQPVQCQPLHSCCCSSHCRLPWRRVDRVPSNSGSCGGDEGSLRSHGRPIRRLRRLCWRHPHRHSSPSFKWPCHQQGGLLLQKGILRLECHGGKSSVALNDENGS